MFTLSWQSSKIDQQSVVDTRKISLTIAKEKQIKKEGTENVYQVSCLLFLFEDQNLGHWKVSKTFRKKRSIWKEKD